MMRRAGKVDDSFHVGSSIQEVMSKTRTMPKRLLLAAFALLTAPPTTVSGHVDRRGVNDFAGFNWCYSGLDVIASGSCLRSAFEGSMPATGSFTLRGRPVDVPSDGNVFIFVRARYYDAENGLPNR